MISARLKRSQLEATALVANPALHVVSKAVLGVALFSQRTITASFANISRPSFGRNSPFKRCHACLERFEFGDRGGGSAQQREVAHD